MNEIIAKLIRLLPRKSTRRIGYKLLRSISSEVRAQTDLFVEPYSEWIAWKSGLGQGIHTLYGLTRTLQPDVIVEIGSARGRSTCTFALACRQNGRGKVYAIDPHTINPWTEYGTNGHTLDFLRERLRLYELTNWCEILPMTSEQAHKEWNKPIDLMFIDGDHTYDGVKKDFDLFKNHLRKNGIVIFHDSLWEYLKNDKQYGKYYREDMGVPRFMDELKTQGYHSVTLRCIPGLTILYPCNGGFDFMPLTDEAAELDMVL